MLPHLHHRLELQLLIVIRFIVPESLLLIELVKLFLDANAGGHTDQLTVGTNTTVVVTVITAATQRTTERATTVEAHWLALEVGT